MTENRPRISDVRVRHVCPSDAKLLAELEGMCGGNIGGKTDYALSLGCTDFLALVAEYEQIPCGFVAAQVWRTRNKKASVKSALRVWSFGTLTGSAQRVVTSQLMSTLKRQMRETRCEQISIAVNERDLATQLLLKDYGFRWVETATAKDDKNDVGYLFVFRPHQTPYQPKNRISKYLADAAGETT